MPPSQLPQPHKRNLISSDFLGGVCHCLQQTLSITSLAEAPFISCTALLCTDAIFLQPKWKITVKVLPSREAEDDSAKTQH